MYVSSGTFLQGSPAQLCILVHCRYARRQTMCMRWGVLPLGDESRQLL